MDQALIEQRHPTLGALVRLWTVSDGQAAAMTPDQLGDLAASTVRITATKLSALILADVGEAVNAIYGVQLEGASADDLTPGRADGSAEARMAMEGQRPVLIEDGASGRRLARLYLPLIGVDGSVASLLCGIVARNRRW